MENFESLFLSSAIKRVGYYKTLADTSLHRLTEAQLYWQPNDTSNSIAVIVQHMAGNMLSRWTDFLTTDGEKAWRNRDAEFENNLPNQQALLRYWEQGWDCFLQALIHLQPDQLTQTIYIRNEPLTVVDAINRQLSHYPYHVGQIVYLARLILNDQWTSLSIPKQQSKAFNQQMGMDSPEPAP